MLEGSRRGLARFGVFESANWRLRDDVRSLGEADRVDLEMWLAEQAWRVASAWDRKPDSPEDWRRALALTGSSAEWPAIGAFADLRRDPPPEARPAPADAGHRSAASLARRLHRGPGGRVDRPACLCRRLRRPLVAIPRGFLASLPGRRARLPPG